VLHNDYNRDTIIDMFMQAYDGAGELHITSSEQDYRERVFVKLYGSNPDAFSMLVEVGEITQKIIVIHGTKQPIRSSKPTA
jgi:hypothetical protein